MSKNLMSMYSTRYPSLFNQSRLRSSSIGKTLPKPVKKVAIQEPPKPEPVAPESPQKKEPIIEPKKESPKKEEILKPPVNEPKDTSNRVYKRKEKNKDELREKFLTKLCKSKKLTSSEKTIGEITSTLEEAEHNPENIRKMEQDTRKKLRILKNSYLFLDEKNNKGTYSNDRPSATDETNEGGTQ